MVPSVARRRRAKEGCPTVPPGLDVSDARRLNAFEDENRRLKKLVADRSLDKAAMKNVLSRKW